MRAARTAAVRFLLACGLVFALPRLARASEPVSTNGVSLQWDAPAECPPVETVTAEIARILGPGSRSRRAVIRAEVTRLTPARWSVHLAAEGDDASGERSFEANSCAALATATALIAAWTIDPLRAAEAMPSPSPPPPPASPSASAERATAPPAPSHAASSGLSGLLAVAAQGDLGTLPRPGLGWEITVGAELRHVRAELSGGAWLEQDATRSSTEGTHLHLVDGALRACWRGALGPAIEVDPCLGAGVAHLTSSGFGETKAYEGDAWWGSARADGVMTLRLTGAMALRVLVGIAVPVTRPSVVILDAQHGNVLLAQPSVATGRAGLGLEVHFP